MGKLRYYTEIESAIEQAGWVPEWMRPDCTSYKHKERSEYQLKLQSAPSSGGKCRITVTERDLDKVVYLDFGVEDVEDASGEVASQLGSFARYYV